MGPFNLPYPKEKSNMLQTAKVYGPYGYNYCDLDLNISSISTKKVLINKGRFFCFNKNRRTLSNITQFHIKFAYFPILELLR